MTELDRSDIRKDGTVDGHHVETHYSPLEYMQLANGCLRFISDGGVINFETRVPVDELLEFIKNASASEGQTTDRQRQKP